MAKETERIWPGEARKRVTLILDDDDTRGNKDLQSKSIKTGGRRDFARQSGIKERKISVLKRQSIGK